MSEHNNMHDLDETADKTVAAINKVDAKVTEMRQRRMADPDDRKVPRAQYHLALTLKPSFACA